jgi:hypothetical protein
MKISLRRKYQLYKIYRKAVLSRQDELASEYGLRVDFVNRLYTVLNIPKELIEEPYDLRKADIEMLSQRYIKEYITYVGQYLDSNDLKELYSIYEVKKIGKFSFLVVFGFSQFNTDKVAKNLYYRALPIISATGLLVWIISKIFN